MKRYEGISPFQSKGLVWNGDSGILLLNDSARVITIKPVLGFEYTGLYCEPTLCHKFHNNEDIALNDLEIQDVMNYLIEQEKLGNLVNGVDSEGKYIEGVSIEDVVRIVSNPPPSQGSWRFDFSKGQGDYWYQAWCVDSTGKYIGNVDEKDAFKVVIVPYPSSSPLGEKWYWNFETKQWIDNRSNTEKLQFIKDMKRRQAWTHFNELFETSLINITINDTKYYFQCDFDTRENINAINTMIALNLPVPNPRPYTPKGLLEPILLSHEQFGTIGFLMAEKKDQLFAIYATHKTAIEAFSENDIELLINYNIMNHWPNQNNEQLEILKNQKILDLTNEKNNLISQLSEPYDASEIIYIEMIETQLTETIFQINNLHSEEEINSITVQWIQFGV